MVQQKGSQIERGAKSLEHAHTRVLDPKREIDDAVHHASEQLLTVETHDLRVRQATVDDRPLCIPAMMEKKGRSSNWIVSAEQGEQACSHSIGPPSKDGASACATASAVPAGVEDP
jgi:hypothetical protein